MISSMTGFGRGTARQDGVEATVELRSVNNRFCEVSTRLPRSLAPYETELQNRIKQAVSRGRISVMVQLEETDPDVVPIRVNEEAARGYGKLLRELARAAGLSGPGGEVRIEHLLTFSDVFTTPDETEGDGDETAWQVTAAALGEALDQLRAMRRQEGAALEQDLNERINIIEKEVQAVEARAPQRVGEARQRLHERLAELVDDERINPDRLELEIAILADKLDVTEECVRLRSHLQLFREALASDEAVGRKLNFLVQEINREVNTIGSKANDPAVAHRAVQMKEELERIREQVQNIE